MTPNKDSTIIDPYPTQSISFSLLTVLDDVPEDTRLWNPETAPQAIVINNVGNKLFPPTLNPLNAGKFIAGCATNTPRTAPMIIPTNRKVLK